MKVLFSLINFNFVVDDGFGGAGIYFDSGSNPGLQRRELDHRQQHLARQRSRGRSLRIHHRERAARLCSRAGWSQQPSGAPSTHLFPRQSCGRHRGIQRLAQHRSARPWTERTWAAPSCTIEAPSKDPRAVVRADHLQSLSLPPRPTWPQIALAAHRSTSNNLVSRRGVVISFVLLPARRAWTARGAKGSEETGPGARCRPRTNVSAS